MERKRKTRYERRDVAFAPRAKNERLLDRAYEHVKSVPYKVGLRWVFYRLFDEGFFGRKGKKAYQQFMQLLSEARNRAYKEWRPDTIADETREVIIRGRGYKNERDWLQAIANGLECELDRHYEQDFYVECWYEARAMTGQFEFYTDDLTLRPMGGQASIAYKYQASKDLEEAAGRYGSPMIVLYFGDLDKYGELIAEVVERDVRRHCAMDFEFIFCGLTLEQVERYNLSEKPDEP